MLFPRARAAAGILTAAAMLTTATGALGATSAAAASADGALTSQQEALDLDLLALDEAGLGRVMVRYDGGVVPEGLLGDLTELGVVRGLEFPSIGTVAVTATPDVLEQVLLDPRVEAFHQQRRITHDLYASREQIQAEEADQPREYQQEVDGETVTRTRPGVTGEGVTVGVIDSGMEQLHPDLVDNTVLGLNFSFSAIEEVGGDAGVLTAEDWDAYAESTGPAALQDDIGHGTHVGSTIGGSGAAAAATSGPDLSGVAPGVEMISLKITTAPAGIVEDFDFEESAVAAFDYILRHNDELGIDVTNNSWGLLPTEPNCLGELPDGCFGLGEDTDFDAASAIADAVVASGVDVVFSAGNSGMSDDGSTTIGGHVGEDTIVVAAACKSVDSGCEEGQDTTDFSSRGAADGTGRQVDVTAPGDQIMAALSPKSVLAPLTECPDTQHPGYFCISGTSMSAPHIAGVAALLREVNPDITPAEVKACILDTADDLPNEQDLTADELVRDAGAGMVDTEAAMQCAHELTPLTAAADGDVNPAVDADEVDTASEPTGQLASTGGGAALLALPLFAGAAVALRRRD